MKKNGETETFRFIDWETFSEESVSLPFDKRVNKYAGSTRFGYISFEHKRMELGWTWYHPELQRTGLNRACKFLLLRYAFEQLGFYRIEIKTSTTNEKSKLAIAKIGASFEGILRKHIINDDGTRRDSVIFSILDDEWPQIRETIFAGY